MIMGMRTVSSLWLVSVLVAAFAVQTVNAQRVGSVTAFQLVAAPSGDVLVGNLTSGSVVYLNNTKPGLTVVAMTNGRIRSIQMGLNTNLNLRVERGAPYALCGGGNATSYAACSDLIAGRHSVVATPRRWFRSGKQVSVSFELVAGSANVPTATAPTAPIAVAPMAPTVLVAPIPATSPAAPKAAPSTPMAPSPIATAPAPAPMPVPAPAPVPVPVPVPAPVPVPVPAPVSVPVPVGPPTLPTISTFPYFISAGGVAYTGTDGTVWVSDALYNPGGTVTILNPNLEIKNTADNGLYRKERYGATMKYNIPVVSGNYQVILHHSESFSEVAFTGGRVFQATLEAGSANAVNSGNIDIFAAMGALHTVHKVTLNTVAVNDGVLNIAFVAVTQNPQVCAIEIRKV